MIEQPRRAVMDRRLQVFAYELGLHTRAEIDTLAGDRLSFVNITAEVELFRGNDLLSFGGIALWQAVILCSYGRSWQGKHRTEDW